LATLEWLNWFNHHRLLEPIGNIPPAQAEAHDYEQLSELHGSLRARPGRRGGAIDFLARNIWLLVPIQGKIREFFKDYDKYP